MHLRSREGQKEIEPKVGMERREERNTEGSAMVGGNSSSAPFMHHAECKSALFAHLYVWKTLTHFEVLEESSV